MLFLCTPNPAYSMSFLSRKVMILFAFFRFPGFPGVASSPARDGNQQACPSYLNSLILSHRITSISGPGSAPGTGLKILKLLVRADLGSGQAYGWRECPKRTAQIQGAGRDARVAESAPRGDAGTGIPPGHLTAANCIGGHA